MVLATSNRAIAAESPRRRSNIHGAIKRCYAIAVALFLEDLDARIFDIKESIMKMLAVNTISATK